MRQTDRHVGKSAARCCNCIRRSQVADVVSGCGITVPARGRDALATAICALVRIRNEATLGKIARDMRQEHRLVERFLREFEWLLISCRQETNT